MRELTIPDGVSSDQDATEMVRFWLAHNKPHVTLLLGMYEDAENCNVDELFAWGQILGDIAQHVANGFQKSHGWDFDKSAKAILTHFIDAMRTRAPGLEGDFPEGA